MMLLLSLIGTRKKNKIIECKVKKENGLAK
jgi:hypothetical protein